MGDLQFRSFTPELEVRSGGDGRTIVGIAVPYGRPQRINAHLTEQFARGAFNKQMQAAHRVPFAREHLGLGGSLIGRTLVLRDDAAGLYGEWRVSKTPVGDETLELVKDGALSDLSIGFRERQNRNMRGNGGESITERVTAELREVAVVLEGAYSDMATVSAVRSASESVCPNCSQPTARLERARQISASLPMLPVS